jgi:hypothetical protein
MSIETLKEVLIEALEDEYKARATYLRIIETFGPVRPFVNIVQAENRHVHALLPLFRKYGFDIPADDWYQRVRVPDTLLEACLAGVQGEIENGEMYDRLLAASNAYADVQAVLRNLQRASQQNHLPAFQRAASRYNDNDHANTPRNQALESTRVNSPGCGRGRHGNQGGFRGRHRPGNNRRGNYGCASNSTAMDRLIIL